MEKSNIRLSQSEKYAKLPISYISVVLICISFKKCIFNGVRNVTHKAIT